MLDDGFRFAQPILPAGYRQPEPDDDQLSIRHFQYSSGWIGSDPKVANGAVASRGARKASTKTRQPVMPDWPAPKLSHW